MDRQTIENPPAGRWNSSDETEHTEPVPKLRLEDSSLGSQSLFSSEEDELAVLRLFEQGEIIRNFNFVVPSRPEDPALYELRVKIARALMHLDELLEKGRECYVVI